MSCQSSLKSIGKNWNSYQAIWDLADAKRRVKHQANISEGLLGVTVELPGWPQRNNLDFKTLPIRSLLVRDKGIRYFNL